MIPWLSRLPAPEEVRAHAADHPVPGPAWPPDFAATGWGYWLRDDGEPCLILLSANDRVWLTDGDQLTEGRCPGAKWLACTAEGIPVCLLPAAPEGAPAPTAQPDPVTRVAFAGDSGCCADCYDSHGYCSYRGHCECHAKHGRAVT